MSNPTKTTAPVNMSSPAARNTQPDRKIESTRRAKFPQRYLVVQSKTGRAFNRAGFRFESKFGTPIDLNDIDEARATEIVEEMHLAVSFVDADGYAMAQAEYAGRGQVDEDDGAPVVTDAGLRTENAKLLEENEALRNEISLLKGRMHQGTEVKATGPIGG